MERIVVSLLDQFERGRLSRRQLVQHLALGMAAASAGGGALAATPHTRELKAVAVNHISYGVADYARTRDFFAGLLGMEVSGDDGTQCALKFGPDSFLVPRRTKLPDNKPFVDHIAYTIENWDKGEVEEELRRRGYDPVPDRDESFHIKDPDGIGVQISSKKLMYVP